MYEPIAQTISSCITIIAFRRPKLLYSTLVALRSNHGIDGMPINIFIDGAREGVAGEKEAVEQTIRVAEKFEWIGKKKIFISKKNKGLHHGVRYAIDTSLLQYESSIIVEDDIVTSPFFFRFMIQGLNLFKDDTDVAAVCGHCYPFSRKRANPSTPYFLKHLACWGWATWRRSWEQVCWDTKVLREHLKKMRGHREINFGIGEFVSGLLEAQHGGYINTWDVQTGVSFFVNQQHCIFPPETLTNNIGWRVTDYSTHTKSESNPNAPMAYTDFLIDKNMPVETSSIMWKAYNKMLYPPKIARKIIFRKMLRFVAPFLRPLKRKLEQKIKKYTTTKK